MFDDLIKYNTSNSKPTELTTEEWLEEYRNWLEEYIQKYSNDLVFGGFTLP